MSDYDVIVVGAGSTAFCSALAAAADQGAKSRGFGTRTRRRFRR